MGNYTELFIGRYYYLSWKNEIPDYLGLIFDESNFYSNFSIEDNWFESIGFITARAKAIDKLETYGFSLHTVADIYSYFYDRLLIDYEQQTAEFINKKVQIGKSLDIETLKKQREQLLSQSKYTHSEELYKFIDYFKYIYSDDFKNPLSKEKVLLLGDGRQIPIEPHPYNIRSIDDSGRIKIDFEALEMYLQEDYFIHPPWLVMLVSLFSSDLGYKYEYPEIITLIFLRIILETIDDEEAEIKLELRDIIEDEDDARSLIHGLGIHLMEKISLYNRVFHTLFLSEEDIQTNYIKSQCREYLDLCNKTNNPYDKGRILENLTEILFTSNYSFQLVSKRVSTGDEEIDLIIKNNVDRPFWNAFNSPLIFVECKNWNAAVGSNEVRNFEIKLQNHKNVVKIGFFISVNGFTTRALDELKRLGRDDYHIVTIDYKDIVEFVSSNKPFFDWLEEIASKIY